jgi:hypothetical protein
MTFKLHQQPISGESFTRCPQIVVDNRLGTAPTVTFHQERVIGLADGATTKAPMQPVVMAFDPTAEIPIINPETGEHTGQTMTQAEVYAAVYSAYLATVAPPDAPDEGGVA